jgi:threonine/homoserine/homoserine lactone efflux protein
MMTVMMAAGKWGGILTLIALAIVVLRQIVMFIGFLTFAIKAGLVLAFVALFVGVAYMIYKSWKQHKNEQQGL